MKILKINSSAAKGTSISRAEVETVVDQLLVKHPNAEVIERDVAYGNLPYPNEEFLGAIFNKGELSQAQQQATAFSDSLVEELMGVDLLVIGAPMYNFGVPASLKAYFDLIARAGKTFKYTDGGFPEGLVKNKKAIVIITSGGVPLRSQMDFSTNHIATFLSFLGITDIEFIELDENQSKLEEKRKTASEKLATILAK